MNTDVRELLVQQGTEAARNHPAEVDRSLRQGSRLFWRRLVLVNLAVVLAVAAFSVGLGAGQVAIEEARQPPKLTSLMVTPSFQDLKVGGRVQLEAEGIYDDGSGRDLTPLARWESNRDTVARVDAQGEVTAERPGRARITASWRGVTDLVVVRVDPRKRTLARITVTAPASTVSAGKSHQLTATATYRNGESKDVTRDARWHTSNPQIADVTSSGIVTTKRSGTVTVVARYRGQEAGMDLVVAPASAALLTIAIVIDHAPGVDDVATPVEVPTGSDVKLSAFGTYDDDSTRDITSRVSWSVDPPGVGAIDATGALTTGPEIGRAEVTATLGNVSGFLPVTVIASTPDIEALSVEPETSDNCPPNGMVDLTATAPYADGSRSEVTPEVLWHSSDEAVAVVDQRGHVTYQGPGQATITASADEVEDSATVFCIVLG